MGKRLTHLVSEVSVVVVCEERRHGCFSYTSSPGGLTSRKMRKAPADVPLPRSPTTPAMFLAAVQMGIWEVWLQTTLCLDCRAFVSFDRSLPMTACLAKALVTGQLAGLSCEAVAGVVEHCHVSAFPPAPPHCLHACYFAVLPPRKSICH